MIVPQVIQVYATMVPPLLLGAPGLAFETWETTVPSPAGLSLNPFLQCGLKEIPRHCPAKIGMPVKATEGEKVEVAALPRTD